MNAHRATELETDSRYDACEPGYASFVEALASVYCGDLDRYVELTGAVARDYGGDRGYGLAAYVDGLQSCGRIEEALALTEESVAAARSLGNPYWISYALWIAGMAFSKADVRRAFAAWDEGVAFVREQPRPLLRRLPRSRCGTLAHHARRCARRADVVRRGAERVPARRQRAAARDHAGQRARAVRTTRPSRAGDGDPRRAVRGTNQPSTTFPSFGSSATVSAARSEDQRADELTAQGAALDLGQAAVYAREQLDVARRTSSPPTGARLDPAA